MRAAAIVLMAGLQVGSLAPAVRASAWTAATFPPAAPAALEAAAPAPSAPASDSADPFPEVAVPVARDAGRGVAWACAGAGLALVGGSFLLHDLADRRYEAYRRETNPDRIEERWRATLRADRWSTASLLTGEALVATAVYLGFVRRPASERVSLALGPRSCVVAVRW